MTHGLLDWAKSPRGGLLSARCECGWVTTPAYKHWRNQEAQVEQLRRHVRSTFDAHLPA